MCFSCFCPADFLRHDGHVQAAEGKTGPAGLQSRYSPAAALLPRRFAENLHPPHCTHISTHRIRQEETVDALWEMQ